ncbi:histidine acid phosphatase [Ordospora colligata]|uniref:Histidine acid phosphatase n=1 Tax=Ordospora colligata OC4 TaxID=1354746 RepID=A0A0B2UJS7_9MICR|nr:histidine acid phosphatase [Ordospora colligata OC4]KHN69277.1 histidine acid phosphatase [Ordospora colligata OC4]TBU15093.1 histidine acid phosphatase [Ordospora colligata]TBU15144.1 histidine acid phosphatase [Ordospora colligata]TBU18390.1 histidine acid phosphatase [Ordospora colligata]
MNISSVLMGSFLISELSDKMYISRKEELRPYLEHCKTEYEFIPKIDDYNLEKLLVVFRHGARAPLKNISAPWKDHSCVACETEQGAISNCKTKKCSEDGELTERGFLQMTDLGRFIKKTYKRFLVDKEIELEHIKARATKIPRTQSSLAGVIKGLTGSKQVSNVYIPDSDDSLMNKFGCVTPDEKTEAKKLFQKTSILLDNEKYVYHPKPQYRADNYYASLCSGVELDCKELNCNINSVVDHMDAANKVWERMAVSGSKDKASRQAVFKDFAKDLLSDIDEKKYIVLYSAHDSSLGSIMSGLDTGISKWPSYASALFIELWCNMGEQYIRMVLNNKVIKPRTFADDYIPINEFISFLNDISSIGKKQGPENPNTGNKTHNIIKHKTI